MPAAACGWRRRPSSATSTGTPPPRCCDQEAAVPQPDPRPAASEPHPLDPAGLAGHDHARRAHRDQATPAVHRAPGTAALTPVGQRQHQAAPIRVEGAADGGDAAGRAAPPQLGVEARPRPRGPAARSRTDAAVHAGPAKRPAARSLAGPPARREAARPRHQRLGVERSGPAAGGRDGTAARDCSGRPASAGRRPARWPARRDFGTASNGRSRRRPATSRTAGIPARPAGPRAARDPDRHRLRLVLALMTQQQVQDAGLGAGRRRAAGSVLPAPRPGRRWRAWRRPNAGCGTRCRPRRAAPRPGSPPPRLPAASPWSTISARTRAAARASPGPRQKRQSHAVRAAGHGHRQARIAARTDPAPRRRAANSAAVSGAAASVAAGGGLLTAQCLTDRRRRVGVPLGQLAEGLAGAVTVAHRGQRHAELEQVVRRARRGIAVGPVVAREHRGGGRVVLAEEVGLAQPVRRRSARGLSFG